MRSGLADREYDNYPIPPLDTSLTPEEIEEEKKKAEEQIQDAITKIKALK